MSGNRLINLPVEIWKLQNLQSLNLSNNHLSNLPWDIGNLLSLKELSLFNNQFSNLPEDVLKQMPNLEKLILKDKYYGGNPLKKEDVETLRQAMPWCEIVWEE